MTIFQRNLWWALENVVHKKATFSIDDVFDEYERLLGPLDSLEIDSVINEAIRRKLIKWDGHYTVARRKQNKMILKTYKVIESCRFCAASKWWWENLWEFLKHPKG